MVLVMALASLSLLYSAVATDVPQEVTSISYTVTTTTNFPMTTAGVMQVVFDSVQLTMEPPQAYSFGVVARTYPGLWVTRLVWSFGDGAFVDVPYCCQTQVSEVRYHAYSQPGPYVVSVIAFDNAGNSGGATMTVNWVTPVPEYPNYGLVVVAPILAALIALAMAKKGILLRRIPTSHQ